MSHVGSVVKVDILKGGVVDALLPETDLLFGGEKDDVTHLQVGEDVGMAVVLRVVMLLHGEDFLIGLGVLCLRIKVVLDEEHECVEERGMEAAGGVQSHEGVEDVLQLRVGSHEVLGFGLAFDCELAEGFFAVLSSAGQLCVLGGQLKDPYDLVLNHGDGERGHCGYARQMREAASVWSEVGELLARGSAHKTLAHQPGQYGTRG